MKRWITTKKFLKFSNLFHKIIQCQYQNLQNTERIILETNSSHWYRFKKDLQTKYSQIESSKE